MYVELWQMGMVFMVGISAYFSFKQGQKEGIEAGVQVVINDLHDKGIISIYRNHEQGEVVVGRYDEVDWDEVVELGEENEEDHW